MRVSISVPRDEGRRFDELISIRFLVAGGVTAGAALGFVGGVAGPLAMIGAVAVGPVGAAVLARPALGVAVLYVTFPVGLYATGLASLQVVELAGAALAGAMAASILTEKGADIRWEPPLTLIVMLLVFAVASTPVALDVALALRQDAALLVAVVLALTTALACSTIRDVRRAVWVFVLVSIWLNGVGIAGASALQAGVTGNVVTGRPVGVFTHANDLGGLAAIAFLLALALAVGTKRRPARLAALIAAGVGFTALLLSFSRGAWLGASLGILVFLWLAPWAWKRLLSNVTVVAAVLIAVVMVLPVHPMLDALGQRWSTLVHPDPLVENPYDDRPEIWREALREVRHDPLTGSGPGNFPIAASRRESTAWAAAPDHAHSILLTVAAEAGIPATLTLLVLAVLLGNGLRRTARGTAQRHDAVLAAGLAGALATQIGQGMFDFTLRNPTMLMLVSSLGGLAYAVIVAPREEAL